MANGAGDGPLVRIEGATKRFGGLAAVNRLSVDIAPDEFFALLGPSGCGKTTLMRLIAGFETLDEGRILIDGQDVAGVPPHRRPVNMMFQSYALFPHMNVERNIAFGLVQEGMARAAITARVAEMLRLVQLEGLGTRKPDQLSGGQRQRVALARALARRPRLLLLDEPLAALDRKLREETQFELMHVQRELGTSFVLVTHDQDEAMVMANRIAVMRDGQIEQIGAARDIYDNPATRWTAGFIGEINLFEAVVETPASSDAALCRLRLATETVVFEAMSRGALQAGQKVALAVRPERVVVTREDPGVGNSLAGEIVDLAFRGDFSLMRVRLSSGFVVRAGRPNVSSPNDRPLARGEAVFARFPIEAGRVLTS